MRRWRGAGRTRALRRGASRPGAGDRARAGPGAPLPLWGHITRWTADDPRFAALEALAQKAVSLPLDEQVALHFALGKAYADCGDIERGFRRQIEGGALQRRMFRYDEAATLHEFGRAVPGHRRRVDAAAREVGDPSPQPVFILGMPRSGTSLVEQILASHPQVRALGERVTLDRRHRPSLRNSRRSRHRCRNVAANWSDAELRRLGALYLKAVAAACAAATATRITDKLPANFRYVGLIHAALPNARIIHTRRDPVDTCLSMFSILFSGLGNVTPTTLGNWVAITAPTRR